MKVCLNCTERQMGCHDRCESYKLEKEKIKQTRKNKDEYTDSYNAMFSPRRIRR